MGRFGEDYALSASNFCLILSLRVSPVEGAPFRLQYLTRRGRTGLCAIGLSNAPLYGPSTPGLGSAVAEWRGGMREVNGAERGATGRAIEDRSGIGAGSIAACNRSCVRIWLSKEGRDATVDRTTSTHLVKSCSALERGE